MSTILNDLFEDRKTTLCALMVDLLRKRKEIEAECKQVREELLALSNGDWMENGIKVTERERQGSVDFEAMIEDGILDKETVERYRKPSTSFWEVKSY